MQNISQTEEFLCFCVIGIIVNFLFDIFRCIRKNFKTKDNIIYVEDIIFLIISTIIIMFGLLKISNGVLRLYIFFGIFMGITIYSLTISKFCIIIINEIVVLCKKIFIFFFKIFKKIFIFLRKLRKKLHV